jgi:hypothetical protein
MKSFGWIFCLSCLVSLPVVQTSHAIDIEDLDEGDKKKKAQKAKKEQIQVAKTEADEVVREIERGLYAKASAGMSMYLLTYGGSLRGGTAIGLSVGGDFVDRDNLSMAWEFSVNQSVHNGEHWESQPGPNFIQGDTRVFGFTASYEFSTYPSRRFGVGVRAGAGLVLTPLLMNKNWYAQDVTSYWGVDPSVHRTPHPVFFGGPTFEYYTKLSHFSIGMDVDIGYAVGFDLGLSSTANMKYTF